MGIPSFSEDTPIIILYEIRAPRFVYGSQALPWQPARSRLPCGTQNDSLSAAAFLP